MQPNAHGQCYSYYGNWNVKDRKPKVGVVYFMIDQHVSKIIEKEKDKFSREIIDILTLFNKQMKDFAKEFKDEIRDVYSAIGDIKTFVDRIIRENELKKPQVEKKNITKKKLANLKEENDDDELEGIF